MARAARGVGVGVERTTQVIVLAVQDNHGALKAGEQSNRICLEIKVKTTQKEGGNAAGKEKKTTLAVA